MAGHCAESSSGCTADQCQVASPVLILSPVAAWLPGSPLSSRSLLAVDGTGARGTPFPEH